ncbi:hypothetical protein HPC49_13060 [Pyxidicoccus fallax]|uniref:Lipoprotein n=1 Tax=Pyxidicoccus fallax TaxID=394095 RepID=A0A848LLZ8_9BACT|nr:hypothetical protein [Pyxidicoccus fallax]NMO18624.1 hypothetical protein [Pyxidicoccus fallax]NPC79165.1 hypothetical protein [Pyxidicoccus fallax]
MRKLFLCAVSLVLAVGCSSGPEQQQAQSAEGFALLQHDATTIEATYSSGGASVRALVVETSKDVVEVTYDFGDPVIGFHIDYNQGVGQFMPSGSPLDAAQAQLLTPLLEGIMKALPQTPDAPRTRVETAAERQTSFMQIVPVGEALTAYEYVSERGWTHISCTCGNQYIGSGYYRTAGRGCGCTGGSGQGCKGRCGQGCGITSTPGCVGTTAYTQDCAKHDYGLGSFSAASDDYTFASNNCSCSGVGTCY